MTKRWQERKPSAQTNLKEEEGMTKSLNKKQPFLFFSEKSS